MSEIKRPLTEQIEELSDQIAALGLTLARIERRVKAALTPPPVWFIPESQEQGDYLAEKNPRDRVSVFREAAERLYQGDRRG